MLAVRPVRLSRRQFAAGALASAAPSGGASLGYVDLTPDFWPAYDAGLGRPDRAERLIRGHFEPHAAVYAGAGVKIDAVRVSRWLDGFDPLAVQARRLGERFSHIYAGHARHFARAFPDFRPEDAPIYLMMSLFTFDGHLQPWGGKVPLFVGLDGVTRFHGTDEGKLAVFLDHEAFHLYQAQLNPDLSLDPAPPLYASIWVEGVATYVSGRLNPAASLLQVLLDDRALTEASPAVIAAGARDALAAMDSTTDDDQARFLSAGFKGSAPARLGYRIGLEIARSAGGRMTPRQMAALPRAALRSLMARELARLAG